MHTKQIFGYNWTVISNYKRGYNVFPKTANVYMIIVRSPIFKMRKIVYVGCTKKLKVRMDCHIVLKSLLKCRTNYTIDILFTSVNDESNFRKLAEVEWRLISRLKPIFNRPNTRNPEKYSQYDFWRELGVTHLVGSYNQKFKITERA